MNGISYDSLRQKGDVTFEDMQNGKGDSPRNMSDRFYKNYQAINWGKKKPSPKPGKKQVFKYSSLKD
jgi:hypothetical protein